MTHWTVYSRPDCGLCEELIADLAELLGAGSLQISIIDISDDSELERKYGRRIPVLLADDDFVCNYRLDRERVMKVLETAQK